MTLILAILSIFLTLLSAVWSSTLVPKGYVVKATQKTRETFIQGPRAHPYTIHEVVIATTQKNIHIIQQEALERATPGHANYQTWLSFDEVSRLVINPTGREKIESWCNQHEINVTWISRRGEYMKASAPVWKWESVLKTELYVYTDNTRPHTPFHIPAHTHTPYYSTDAYTHTDTPTHLTFIRGHTYHLPEDMHIHIHAIFNMVDAPPVMHPHLKPHRYAEHKSLLTVEERGLRGRDKVRDTHVSPTSSSYNGYVTVSFLNSQYGISTNMGDNSLNQSVFQTNNEYYSPTDLTSFQQTFDLTIQPVSENIGMVYGIWRMVYDSCLTCAIWCAHCKSSAV
ncbi:hypothetical protein EON63_16290 [archaeon]|nr:MAG: hypothetical protein EON63_16290 [archaeon]